MEYDEWAKKNCSLCNVRGIEETCSDKSSYLPKNFDKGRVRNWHGLPVASHTVEVADCPTRIQLIQNQDELSKKYGLLGLLLLWPFLHFKKTLEARAIMDDPISVDPSTDMLRNNKISYPS